LGTNYHCIKNPVGGVTAAGASVVVSFDAALNFTDSRYTLVINNDTVLATVPPVTAKASTGFTFTSTATNVYSYQACGE
jgi:hypothetical protein